MGFLISMNRKEYNMLIVQDLKVVPKVIRITKAWNYDNPTIFLHKKPE